jgi:predicted dehydrogenase
MKFSLRLLACLVAPVALLRAQPEIKIGFLSLDTSHAPAFASLFNDPANKAHVAGARVVCAFPGGSPDLEASWSRVKGYTAEVRDKYGVAIVDTVAEVVARSDAIIILSVDGRAHLPLARAVFSSGKPVFIDKPLGANLREVLAIARLAEETKTPLFSASSLRYSPGVQKLRTTNIGKMLGAISYGPAALEPHHTDLYWYGIHATEALYTVMGTGCATVSRVHTAATDVATGVWSDGRTGVVYGYRDGKGLYRVTVFGTTAVRDQEDGHDYAPMLKEVVEFFRTRQAPVPIAETIELMAFMEAADESKRSGGAPVSLKDVIAKNQ